MRKVGWLFFGIAAVLGLAAAWFAVDGVFLTPESDKPLQWAALAAAVGGGCGAFGGLSLAVDRRRSALLALGRRALDGVGRLTAGLVGGVSYVIRGIVLAVVWVLASILRAGVAVIVAAARVLGELGKEIIKLLPAPDWWDFKRLISYEIIKVAYFIGFWAILVGWILAVVGGFGGGGLPQSGPFGAGIPRFLFATLAMTVVQLFWRLGCEFAILFWSIHRQLVEINANTARKAAAPATTPLL